MLLEVSIEISVGGVIEMVVVVAIAAGVVFKAYVLETILEVVVIVVVVLEVVVVVLVVVVAVVVFLEVVVAVVVLEV